MFTSPVTECPLIGSTEQWDIVNTNDPDDDADAGAHMIHLHLLEFQVLNRQRFDNERFLQDWFIFNGHRPMTRPIVLDERLPDRRPDPAAPNETGWKDTVRATRARHAASSPGGRPKSFPPAASNRARTGIPWMSTSRAAGTRSPARATCGTATCSATRTTT